MHQFWRGTVAVAGVLPSLAFGAMRPDKNAFLDEAVSSPSQLVHQVHARSDVRDRYLRHYGMTENELYSYLLTLRLQTLPKPEVVNVYSVPGSGEVKVHEQRLHKGDLVFVDANGRHALLARCGNPLSLGPSNVGNMALASPAVEGSEIVAMRAMPDLTVAPVMMIDPGPAIAMNVPPDTIADVTTDIPEVVTTVVTAPVASVAPVPLPPAAPVLGGGSNNGSPLALIPLLGGGALLGILASNHGGGGTPIAPAPEPGTLVCLTVGAIALVKRRRP